MTIKNYRQSEIQDVIQKLQDSSFEFYLTGSRFFTTDHEQSDWDFFTSNNKEVIAYLSTLGFQKVNTKYSYFDKQTVGVMRFGSPYLYHIDIQLVLDVEIKQIAQEILTMKPPVKTSDDANLAQQWNTVYHVAKRVSLMLLKKIRT